MKIPSQGKMIFLQIDALDGKRKRGKWIRVLYRIWHPSEVEVFEIDAFCQKNGIPFRIIVDTILPTGTTHNIESGHHHPNESYGSLDIVSCISKSKDRPHQHDTVNKIGPGH